MPADALTPKLLSVITPVAQGGADFLAAAWSSLAEQRLPEGWRLEWLVQSDGPAPDLQATLTTITNDHPSVRFAATLQPNGAAIARNTALGRARGELLMNLDADDQYEVGAIAPLVTAMVADRSLGWVGGRTVYVNNKGAMAPYPDRLPIGPVEPGRFGDDWLAHDRPAGHPSAFVVRTAQWSAFGGWMALHGSEDTGTLVALSEYWPGQAIDQLVLRYRKWPGQTTAADDWRADKSEHHQAIARRLASIRSLLNSR